MKSTQRIHMTMTWQEALLELAEGNPGAITVLARLLKHPQGPATILELDQQGIYGSAIWILYKDQHQENLEALIGAVWSRAAFAPISEPLQSTTAESANSGVRNATS